MNLKLYRSATVGLKFDNFKILMDPWLTDGEYYGSWSHVPYFDLDKNLQEINSYDAIYISHIHPDHCSEKTLKKISKKIPIYIHTFHKKFLKLKLENLGFTVYELQNNKKINIGSDVEINIIAADNCNPELCFKHVGCSVLNGNRENSQQIDTIAIINDKKYCVVNTNDAPYELSLETINEIKNQYEKVDLLLTGYSGAGPYPQCFPLLTKNEMIIEAKKKREFFLNQAFNFIEKFKPLNYFLFAGTYTLTGSLWELEKYKGTPTFDEGVNYIEKKINLLNIKNITPVRINPDNEFDFKSNNLLLNYKIISKNEINNYAERILSFKKLDYENKKLADKEEIIDLSNIALSRFNNFKQLTKSKFKTDVYISLDEEFIKISDKNNKVSLVKKINTDVDYLYMKLNQNLLFNILKGPKFAHWNNADIGSHIRFFRNQDYRKDLHFCLNFFHS
ncbi:MAG: hypothetical protein CMC22_06985 [Flavobacteriaceae bacterium]|nr:hypothetical protein [Flavobacteriaceae bacterium]|tara:strand:- start:1465 stop:2811 length:1347 start_codon:yes stop_codon:yes gene_type:complete